MPRKKSAKNKTPAASDLSLPRLDRPLGLTAQVERELRQAIADGRYPSGRLPTEVDLAEQLGVSRETVRLAAEALQREGLVVKVRRRGTFIQPQRVSSLREPVRPRLLGYVQADYEIGSGQEEAVTQTVSGLMLQGALAEAGRADYRLVMQHATAAKLSRTFEALHHAVPLAGVIFASCGEQNLVKRAIGLGLPTVLLDHDLNVAQAHSVREDSFEAARTAVHYLASLGHRRIAFANWRQTDLNPWRLQGYRQGLRDAGLPRRRLWELHVELTERGASQVVAHWLSLSPRPGAIYCFNNTLARYVLQELHQCGVLVPAEVNVMGGGGEEVPGLTCHQADWQELGRTAVQILLRAQGAGPRGRSEHLLVPHEVRAASTTGMLRSP